MKRKLFYVVLSVVAALPLSLDAKEKKSDVKKFQVRVSSAECYLVRHDGSHWDGKGHSPSLKALTLAKAKAEPDKAAALATLLHDDGAAPDPYYRLMVDGHVVIESSAVKNSYAPAWHDGGKTISVKTHSKVEITVLDKNSGHEDLMESFTITGANLGGATKSGKLVLRGSKGISEVTLEVSAK